MRQRITPKSALKGTASFWFIMAAVGHWIFLTYVVVVFGGMAAQGNMAGWNGRLSQGYVEGDHIGNAIVAAHLFLGVVVLGAGPLQFIPWIRARFPAFHRWLGRVYVLGVGAVTVSGMHMLFARDVGSVSLKAGFVLQAILLAVFAGYAVRTAMKRQIARHRRWAMRFFMVASIALTYRVIFMIWMLVTGGAGINMETGEGAFLDFMALGQFFPLLVLEVYLWVGKKGSAKQRVALASFLGLAAVATGLGVVMLTFGLWFPFG